MNKVRCTQCRCYFDRADAVWRNGTQHLCSTRCMNDYRRRRVVKPRREPKIPVATRYEVKERDGHQCRWCGAKGTQCHHVVYRSSGGIDLPTNLVLLCASCHTKAHSSKQAFQPLLLAYLWLLYVEGVKLTIPEVARHLDRLGLLTDLQHLRTSESSGRRAR